MSQVPDPQRLVPGGRYERERAILWEDQVSHDAFVAVEVEHGLAWSQKRTSARRRKTVNASARLAEVSPVNTFQILITPFSRPVASSRLFLPLVGALTGRVPAGVLGGLGPKARPQTGWPQLKLLSPRSVSAF